MAGLKRVPAQVRDGKLRIAQSEANRVKGAPPWRNRSANELLFVMHITKGGRPTGASQLLHTRSHANRRPLRGALHWQEWKNAGQFAVSAVWVVQHQV
jgi:hypothetical protein